MPFNALVFNLRSKVELNWTRAIRPVIAQSVQFSKIAKKLNIDLCQFFSHWKEALFLLKSWKKNGGHRTRFCGRAADSAHHMHFLRLLREDWGVFQNGVYVEAGKRQWIIRFFRIYIEISQLGRNVIKMVLKWKSKCETTRSKSTVEVLPKKVELSNMRIAYVMHISNTSSSSRQETTTNENSNSVSLESTSF